MRALALLLLAACAPARVPAAKDAGVPFDATTEHRDPDPVDWCDPCFVLHGVDDPRCWPL